MCRRPSLFRWASAFHVTYTYTCQKICKEQTMDNASWWLQTPQCNSPLKSLPVKFWYSLKEEHLQYAYNPYDTLFKAIPSQGRVLFIVFYPNNTLQPLQRRSDFMPFFISIFYFGNFIFQETWFVLACTCQCVLLFKMTMWARYSGTCLNPNIQEAEEGGPAFWKQTNKKGKKM